MYYIVVAGVMRLKEDDIDRGINHSYMNVHLFTQWEVKGETKFILFWYAP